MTTTLDARHPGGGDRRRLRRQLLGLGGDRARDGAVVVVDNASGDVLAYVGGVGGASTAAAVDNAAAYRQAGSTLKPFLYGQAIERGYLTAASILDDSPVQLDTASGLYVPQGLRPSLQGRRSASAPRWPGRSTFRRCAPCCSTASRSSATGCGTSAIAA